MDVRGHLTARKETMPLTAAPEDQALLLELQALDTKLQQLARRVEKLPERQVVDTLAAQRGELERSRSELFGAVEDARLELKRTEADVGVVDARIARDSERLQSSTSVKDVQALEQELAALAKRKNDLEDIELAVMETVEEREAVLAATDAELASLAASLAEATSSRDEALGALDAERADTLANRQSVAGKVPTDLLALYEKQRDRYGTGASHLRAGISSASGVALKASDLDAIRAAAPEAVLLCPDSNAILVRTSESGL
jgi:predicted  nucleic acid-binding Zn-ribbon protein